MTEPLIIIHIQLTLSGYFNQVVTLISVQWLHLSNWVYFLEFNISRYGRIIKQIHSKMYYGDKGIVEIAAITRDGQSI